MKRVFASLSDKGLKKNFLQKAIEERHMSLAHVNVVRFPAICSEKDNLQKNWTSESISTENY